MNESGFLSFLGGCQQWIILLNSVKWTVCWKGGNSAAILSKNQFHSSKKLAVPCFYSFYRYQVENNSSHLSGKCDTTNDWSNSNFLDKNTRGVRQLIRKHLRLGKKWIYNFNWSQEIKNAFSFDVMHEKPEWRKKDRRWQCCSPTHTRLSEQVLIDQLLQLIWVRVHSWGKVLLIDQLIILLISQK